MNDDMRLILDKMDKNHSEILGRFGVIDNHLSTIDSRLENHSVRIGNVEERQKSMEPRLSYTERIIYGVIAVAAVISAILGYIVTSAKNSTRLTVQEELRNQDYVASRVVEKVKEVANIKQ